jgi:hypothetical protein
MMSTLEKGRRLRRLEPLISVVVSLRLEQVQKLAVINSLVSESWDKTLQDAVDIALERYEEIAEIRRKKLGGHDAD